MARISASVRDSSRPEFRSACRSAAMLAVVLMTSLRHEAGDALEVLLVLASAGLAHRAEVDPRPSTHAQLLDGGAQEHRADVVAAEPAQVPGGGGRGGEHQDLLDVGEVALQPGGRRVIGPGLLHDLVDKALDDGGHVAPPDRADEDNARGALDELLVMAHQRVQRAALAEQGQLLGGVARVEAIGVEVDDVVGPVRLVQGGGGGLEHGVVEGAVVGVGVDDEGALARLLGSFLGGHQLSPIVTMARRAARMKVASAVVAPTAMSWV